MFDGKDLEQRMGIERVLQNGMQHNCVNSKCCWAKNIDLKSQTDNRQSHQMDRSRSAYQQYNQKINHQPLGVTYFSMSQFDFYCTIFFL